MDVVAPAAFVTDLIGRIVGALSNRPRLGVKIISFRPDSAGRRLVFRARALNFGRVRACGCEGFWAVFDPNLCEVESGLGVFWTPQADDDYEFENRETRSAAVEYNERKFCWAELDLTNVPLGRTDIRLFPYDCPEGLYTFALILEYGQYKSFDSVRLRVAHRIPRSAPVSDAMEGLELEWRRGRGLRGLLRQRKLARLVGKTDYHDLIRPT